MPELFQIIKIFVIIIIIIIIVFTSLALLQTDFFISEYFVVLIFELISCSFEVFDDC